MAAEEDSTYKTIGSEGELPEGFTRRIHSVIYSIWNVDGKLVEVGLLDGVGLTEAGHARLRELELKKDQISASE